MFRLPTRAYPAWGSLPKFISDRLLEVQTSPENFPARKHNLIQAILAVNDLFYLASPIVESLFFEDVVAWLEANDIRYTPKVKFTGTSGFDHLFDFVIPKSPRKQPERIVQAINRPTRDTASKPNAGARPPSSPIVKMRKVPPHIVPPALSGFCSPGRKIGVFAGL